MPYRCQILTCGQPISTCCPPTATASAHQKFRDDRGLAASFCTSIPPGRLTSGGSRAAAVVSILGELTTIDIPPSDFEVHPFVGWVNGGERPSFIPETREVAEILEVPLFHLLDPDTRQVGPIPVRGATYTVPYYNVDGHKVWGATAILLSEFLGRIQYVLKLPEAK